MTACTEASAAAIDWVSEKTDPTNDAPTRKSVPTADVKLFAKEFSDCSGN